MSFQLEQNVPPIYVDESRDFQLLCRELDIYLNGCMDRSANMRYQLDVNNCNESLLYVIADMQGFDTTMYIPSNILRNILKVFPWCIQRKGTEEAIRVATYAVMATYKYIYDIEVEIIHSSGLYEINIRLMGLDSYIPYIREVLRYLIPTGFQVNIYNVETRKTEMDDRAEIEDYVSFITGISGVILGAKPVYFVPSYTNDIMFTSETATLSRIGIARIVKSRSRAEIVDQKHIGVYKVDGESLANSSGGTDYKSLFNSQGKPIMIIGNKKEIDE